MENHFVDQWPINGALSRMWNLIGTQSSYDIDKKFISMSFRPVLLSDDLNLFNSFITEAPLRSKSMEWFLYNTDLRKERVKNEEGRSVFRNLSSLYDGAFLQK